jgi:CTP:phosphocholine cytidylyltransferase-like protein
MKKKTNNCYVTSAHTYIENALRQLEYLKNEQDGTLLYGQMFNLKSAITSLKMSKAMLKKTTFNHKDKYTRRMKE